MSSLDVEISRLFIAATREEDGAWAVQSPRTSSLGEPLSGDSFAIPPVHLMEYKEPPESHLSFGKKAVDNMKDALLACGFPVGKFRKTLEFGCSNGRMIRWLAAEAESSEYWGCDIQADKIYWCVENLTPRFNFFLNTTVPHLPFADGYFDFVYAGSVFTHLNETCLAWFLEMGRIISRGGILYITLNDVDAYQVLLERLGENPNHHVARKLTEPRFSKEFHTGKRGFVSVSPYGKGNLSLILMSIEYLQLATRHQFTFVARIPKSFEGVQTAVILQRK